MQTFEDKVDDAVHAAFTAFGLTVGNHMDLAYRLNDFITQGFQFIARDEGDRPADDPPEDSAEVGGHCHDR